MPPPGPTENGGNGPLPPLPSLPPATPSPSTTLAALAAAASTSASLWNLNDLLETVKMMSAGRVFTGYFANPSLHEPIKQDLFVFFDCSPNVATAAPSTASTSANGVKKPPVPQLRPPVMHLGGALYWSVVGKDGSLHRTRAADLSLALNDIDDIYLGKRTNAFTLPFASRAQEECCFSLIAKNRTHMNFEAKNPVHLVSWLFGLKRLVQANKKLISNEPPSPSSSTTSSTAAHPVSASPGPSLDIHDTNKTSLKQDIWQVFLQGIQQGTQLFQQTMAPQPKPPPQPPLPQPQLPPQPSLPTPQQQPLTQLNNNAHSSKQPAPTPTPTPKAAAPVASSGGFLANLLRKTISSSSSEPRAAKPPSSPAAVTSNVQHPASPGVQSQRLQPPNTSPPGSLQRGGFSRSPQQHSFSPEYPAETAVDPLQIFQILGRIGQGNYGYVYKARDTRDESLVAIKILEVDSAASSKELEAEIAILAKCHSKYIVSYRGTFTRGANNAGSPTATATPHQHNPQQCWLVMEYCIAGSVCDLMAITDRVLNELQISSILNMCLQGLAYFHSLKHLHRDVKAGNILINHDGIVKLSDFGVSAQLNASLSKRKTVIGSPYWMAPEVINSNASARPYDEKADIWSLGATCIELATGDPPYHDIHPLKAIFAIPQLPPPRLPQFQSDGQPCAWSKEFQDFVALCLVKDPDARPSALQLQTHPFIARTSLAQAQTVIKQLVIESMPDIDKYREIEARMANKVAFGSRRRGTGGGGGDSDSEYSVSRSRSSISRSFNADYSSYPSMRSAHSISDLRNLVSQGGAQGARSNRGTARWEKELSRSERDRDRVRREKEWENELSARREQEYSQRSQSPSFSGSYETLSLPQATRRLVQHASSFELDSPRSQSGLGSGGAGFGSDGQPFRLNTSASSGHNHNLNQSFEEDGERDEPDLMSERLDHSTGGKSLQGSPTSFNQAYLDASRQSPPEVSTDHPLYPGSTSTNAIPPSMTNTLSQTGTPVLTRPSSRRSDTSAASETPPQEHLLPRTPLAVDYANHPTSSQFQLPGAQPIPSSTNGAESSKHIFTTSTSHDDLKDFIKSHGPMPVGSWSSDSATVTQTSSSTSSVLTSQLSQQAQPTSSDLIFTSGRGASSSVESFDSVDDSVEDEDTADGTKTPKAATPFTKANDTSSHQGDPSSTADASTTTDVNPNKATTQTQKKRNRKKTKTADHGQ